MSAFLLWKVGPPLSWQDLICEILFSCCVLWIRVSIVSTLHVQAIFPALVN